MNFTQQTIMSLLVIFTCLSVLERPALGQTPPLAKTSSQQQTSQQVPKNPLRKKRHRRVNVLLISIDDLNDWVGCLEGHPQSKTPHIDQLAKQGTLFTNAHCQAPVCTPSRASFVSGMLPSSTQSYFLQPHLSLIKNLKHELTLSPHFQREGYHTIGVGKIYGGQEERFFQEYGGKFGGFGPVPEKKINHPIGHPLWDWGAYPETDKEMPDHKIASWATKRLSQPMHKPFFMAVGFQRPHVPMYVPKKWHDMHPLDKIKLPVTLNTDRDDLSEYAKGLTHGHPAPRHEWFLKKENQGQWEKAVQSYLASSTFVDHCVGRVLAALKKSPHADNTIVVLLSDHGFHLGEKQRWAKRTLWEDSTRVPMIITLPQSRFSQKKFPRDQRCSQPVGLIDIYPTLLEMCNMPSYEKLEGHSLKPLLRNAQSKWAYPAITTFGPHNHAIRSQHYRFIQYADGSQELYDHRTDPHEWNNLAKQAKMKDVILEHQKWLPKKNLPVILTHPNYGLEKYLETEERINGRIFRPLLK